MKMAIFVLTLCALCSSALADDAYWIVRADDAKCIVKNTGKFLALPDAPILIYVKDCPRNDAAAALEKSQKSSFLPGADSGKAREDEVLVFSRKDLRCLDEGDVVSNGDFALIPRNVPCD